MSEVIYAHQDLYTPSLLEENISIAVRTSENNIKTIFDTHDGVRLLIY
jgi:hypothetical protein